VQRLMQEWGLYWFFEHENGIHNLIVVDSISMLNSPKSEPYKTLSYYPPERRINERGRGLELTTELWGVMRAMQGLMLSTDASNGPVKDMQAAIFRLEQELRASSIAFSIGP